MIDGSDDYESVLFVARECYVYRIPPRKSTAGYRAAEWGDMEAFLWKGRLRIIEKGTTCAIRMEDKDSGELFALCPYDVSGQTVESVLDSSRYFVLRVESEAPDGGPKKKAFIGMGFQDRSESFDFQVALQDWTKRAKAAQASPVSGEDAAADADLIDAQPNTTAPTGPKQDYSLKEGQTFSIKIPGGAAGGGGRKIRDQSGASSAFGGSGGPLLPPPPSRR